jgi:hypothetical protein
MIYRRGKKGTCWYRFRFANRIVHESTRTTSKTLAREAERQRRRGLAETFNGIQKRTLPPTLSQAAKVWIEKRAGLKAVTRTTYEAALAHPPRSCPRSEEDPFSLVAKAQNRRVQDLSLSTLGPCQAI